MSTDQMPVKIDDTANAISSAIKQHGFPTVLSVVLISLFGVIAFFHVRATSEREEVYRSATNKQVDQLTESVSTERTYVRTTLTELVQQNIEATKNHTMAVEKLTDEIKRK